MDIINPAIGEQVVTGANGWHYAVIVEFDPYRVGPSRCQDGPADGFDNIPEAQQAAREWLNKPAAIRAHIQQRRCQNNYLLARELIETIES